MSWRQEGNLIVYDNSGRFLELSENALNGLLFKYGNEAEGAKIKKNIYLIFDEMESILEAITVENFVGFYVTRAIDPYAPDSPHSEGRAIDISKAYFFDGKNVGEINCYKGHQFWIEFAQLLANKYPTPFNQFICPVGIIDFRWNRKTVIDNFLKDEKLISDGDLKNVDKLLTEHKDHFHINLVK